MNKKIRTAIFFVTLLATIPTWAAYPSWRPAADARIYTNRMRNIEITVKDAAGNLVPNAAVKVDMQRHAFNFGCAVKAPTFSKAHDGTALSTDEQARHDYTLKLFNTVVFENDLLNSQIILLSKMTF